jgi:DNA polymerase III sliding clamp (beta) subunit (PCNA family)
MTTINFDERQFESFKKEAAPFIKFIGANKFNELHLQPVTFEIHPDYLFISVAGYNCEAGFITRMARISGESTKFAVNLNEFKDFLKLKTATSIQKDGDKICFHDWNVEDMSHDVREFIRDDSNPKYFSIPNAKQIFKSAGNFVKKVKKGDERGGTAGVYFNIKDGLMKTCTTDYYKMRHTVQDFLDVEDLSFVLPIEIAISVESVVNNNPNCFVGGYLFKKMVTVVVGSYTFTSYMSDNWYPDYESGIPSQTTFAVQLDKKSLISAIKKVSPSTNKYKKLITLTFHNNKLVVFGWDEHEKTKEFAEVDLSSFKTFDEGTDSWTEDNTTSFTSGFNYSYLLKVLNCMVGKTITINFKNPYRLAPVLFSSPKNGIQQPIILMPVDLYKNLDNVPIPKDITEEQIETFMKTMEIEKEGNPVLDKSFFETVFNTFYFDQKFLFLFWGVVPKLDQYNVRATLRIFLQDNGFELKQNEDVYLDKIFGGWTLEQVKEFCETEKENVD